MKQRETGACQSDFNCICKAGSCSKGCTIMNYEERRPQPAEFRSGRQLYDAELQHYYFYQVQLGQKVG